MNTSMVSNTTGRQRSVTSKPAWVPSVGEMVIVRTMYSPLGEYLCRVVKVTAREVVLADHHRFKLPSLERIGAQRGYSHKLHQIAPTKEMK